MTKTTYELCPVCEGRGTTVNPNIDDKGLTREDFLDDPDFMEDYMSGVYDVTCRCCKGLRVVEEGTVEKLREAAEDRRLAALENGDWDAYQGANDWRHGY